MRSRRVVIAEDEGVVALDLRVRVEGLGHEVVAWVTTGEQAVARAREGVDLVIMDVTLQGAMDGLEAARRLRSATVAAPILFLTAHGDLVTEGLRAELAPCACLTKPFDGGALTAALTGLLG